MRGSLCALGMVTLAFVPCLRSGATPPANATITHFGSSVNHSLLDAMARLGGGAYTFIPNDRDAPALLKRFTGWITRPYLTDLSIDWGALPVGEWIPGIPRDLFCGCWRGSRPAQFR